MGELVLLPPGAMSLPRLNRWRGPSFFHDPHLFTSANLLLDYSEYNYRLHRSLKASCVCRGRRKVRGAVQQVKVGPFHRPTRSRKDREGHRGDQRSRRVAVVREVRTCLRSFQTFNHVGLANLASSTLLILKQGLCRRPCFSQSNQPRLITIFLSHSCHTPASTNFSRSFS